MRTYYPLGSRVAPHKFNGSFFDCNPASTGPDASSGPKPADISFLIKKDKKPILTEVILRDFPDTVFQETTTPPIAKSDLEIAKARD